MSLDEEAAKAVGAKLAQGTPEAIMQAVGSAILPTLEETGQKLGDSFLDAYKDQLKNIGNGPARERCGAFLQRAARFRLQALQADGDEQRARMEAEESALRSFRVTLLAEGLVADEVTAALMAHNAKIALDVLVGVGQVLAQKVGESLIQGALAGLAGGGGFDLKSVSKGFNPFK